MSDLTWTVKCPTCETRHSTSIAPSPYVGMVRQGEEVSVGSRLCENRKCGTVFRLHFRVVALIPKGHFRVSAMVTGHPVHEVGI